MNTSLATTERQPKSGNRPVDNLDWPDTPPVGNQPLADNPILSIHKRIEWLDSQDGLNNSEAHVLLRIVYHDGDGAGCFASQSTLATETRLSVRQVGRVVRRLRDRGYIKWSGHHTWPGIHKPQTDIYLPDYTKTIGHSVLPSTERQDISTKTTGHFDQNDRTSCPERQDTVSYKPNVEPNMKGTGNMRVRAHEVSISLKENQDDGVNDQLAVEHSDNGRDTIGDDRMTYYEFLALIRALNPALTARGHKTLFQLHPTCTNETALAAEYQQGHLFRDHIAYCRNAEVDIDSILAKVRSN